MADTLIDPPEPPQPASPTMIDDGLAAQTIAAPAPAAAPVPVPLPVPAGSSRGLRLVVLVLAALAALLSVAGVAVYLFVWRYEPTAARHLPANAHLAIRFEASEILLFAPVREHLWPLLDDGASSAAGAPKPARASRASRIMDATGVDLRTDLREAIVASTDAASWVVVVGGRISRGRFVDGMERVLREEGTSGWTKSGELLVGPGGISIGQADDGSLIVGNDREIVTASLAVSDAAQRLELPADGAVTFAATREAWAGAAGVLTQALPRGAALGKIERAHGVMALGEAPELKVTMVPVVGVAPAALASEIDTLLGDLRLLLLLAPEVAGEKRALGNARVAAVGEVVVVTAPWPREGLDRGAESLAKLLRAGRVLAPGATGSPSPHPL